MLKIVFGDIVSTGSKRIDIHSDTGTQDCVSLDIRYSLILHDGQSVAEVGLGYGKIIGNSLISSFFLVLPVFTLWIYQYDTCAIVASEFCQPVTSSIK